MKSGDEKRRSRLERRAASFSHGDEFGDGVR
jgi:hypothetical protein